MRTHPAERRLRVPAAAADPPTHRPGPGRPEVPRLGVAAAAPRRMPLASITLLLRRCPRGAGGAFGVQRALAQPPRRGLATSRLALASAAGSSSQLVCGPPLTCPLVAIAVSPGRGRLV